MTHIYDDRFFDWVNKTAIQSARTVLPLVRQSVAATSVVDVGCGEGTWLSVWRDLGVEDQCGIDGDYVVARRLRIAADSFVAADLARGFRMPRRFDLVQSLEVAEHLPRDAAACFVENLCALGDVILFSAAQPGQGGEEHINERRPSYWGRLFQRAGYSAYDPLRPRLRSCRDVAPWYRFNTIVYANAAGRERLSAAAVAARVTNLAALDRSADLAWELRRMVLRPLPTGVVSWLSRARYRVACQFSAA